jgi:putative ABC transport system permease protein
MNLRNIAFYNLLRRKTRSVFVIIGLVISVATVVALLSFVEAMTHYIDHNLEKYGANILIVPKTESLALSYGGLSLGGVSFEMEEIREEQLARIWSIKNSANIAALGPLVLGAVQVQEHKVLLAGLDFKTINILKPWWNIAGQIPDAQGAVLGSKVAAVLGLKTGDPVLIRDRNLRVSGILNPTGSQDDDLIFVTLKTAQELLGKQGRISMVELAALCRNCPIEEMVKQVSEVLPGANVMAIQQVVKGRMETLSQFKKLSYGVSSVVLLVGALLVLVTMMSSVRERTSEIGIFRAIGFRQSHVMKIIYLEALIISGLAGLIGYFVGLGATKLALLLFTDGMGTAVPFEVWMITGAVISATIIGLAASTYPAFMAARLDPSESLRAL